MEIYEKRGRWVVDSEDTRRKFNTKAEAEAYAAGLGSPVEEPTNGDEKEETYTEEFNFSQEEDSSEEKDSSPVIGVSKKDFKRKGKKK
jgi:hypothetical protein